MNDNTSPGKFAELPSLEEFAPDPFSKKLEHARRIYSDLGFSFDAEARLLADERSAAKARDPVSYEEWEHLIFDDQEYDLEELQMLSGQLVIVFLAFGIRELLEETKRECQIRCMRSTQTLKRNKKQRGKPLEDLRQSLGTFGIDLARSPSWGTVEEIVLARHAVIHPESMKDCQRLRPNSRYFGTGEVRLTATGLNQTLAELSAFSTWLRKEVKARREDRAAPNPARSLPPRSE